MLSDNSYCSINRVLLCATGFASVCCNWGEHWQSQWHAIDVIQAGTHAAEKLMAEK